MRGQRHVPDALPPGKTRYPLYRRLGGPQARSGWVRKISPPPGFDPRNVQAVTSRHTDWATGPTDSLNSRRLLYLHVCVHASTQLNSWNNGLIFHKTRIYVIFSQPIKTPYILIYTSSSNNMADNPTRTVGFAQWKCHIYHSIKGFEVMHSNTCLKLWKSCWMDLCNLRPFCGYFLLYTVVLY